MNNRIKESERNLDQIMIDDKLCRRDLATYELKAQKRINLIPLCDEIESTIKMRTQRLDQIIKNE